jgi:hypothetical protein
MAEATDRSEGTKKRRVGSIFVWLLAAGVLFAFYESIVLMLIGMIPTGIALLLDRSPQKDQARSVGYLNFAGCMPWMVDFWMSGGGFGRVFEIVGDPIILSVMYASAATGWGLCFIVRPFVTTYLIVASEIKESQVTKRQAELTDIWGEEVRGGDKSGEGSAAQG